MELGTQYTWGISGPAFLVAYGILVALTGVVWLVLRRVNDQPERIAYDAGGPDDPLVVAALDGEDRAVLVALYRLARVHSIRFENAALAQAGLLSDTVSWRSPREVTDRLRALGPATVLQPMRPPSPASALEWRLYNEIAAVPGSLVTTIRGRVAGGPELSALRQRLMAMGLVREPGTVLVLRLAAAVFLVPVAIGAARIAAGSANHRPVQYLTMAVAATVGLGVLAAWKVGPLTRRGRKVRASAARAAARTRGRSRTPVNPSYLDPLILAAQGPGALWRHDAPMAALLAPAYLATAYWTFLPPVPGNRSWGAGGDASSSCASGSSCGSSSCGGGSGCGGGGCGG